MGGEEAFPALGGGGGAGGRFEDGDEEEGGGESDEDEDEESETTVEERAEEKNTSNGTNLPQIDSLNITPTTPSPAVTKPEPEPFQQVYEDDSSSDDGSNDPADDDGWITPKNVSKQKARDLGLLPGTDSSADGNGNGKGKGKNKAPEGPVEVACLTGDYAVQNVLLQMGLGLVGEGGKRIGRVKSWVLRCHACFK